jgi:hypothetical protein
MKSKKIGSGRYRKNRKNKNNKYTKYKSKNCSPNSSSNFTCFSKNALLNMLDSWNLYYDNNKINYRKTDKLKNLWNKLDNKLKNICNNEYCWTKQKFVTSNKEIKESFRPEMPEKWKDNKNEWLNTLDIEAVMKQYEEKYPDFIFLGPVPIDFDHELHPGMCVINELCNINLQKLLNNKKNKIGIIFNLDPHDKPGSHWVSLFADFDKENKVYYFDSYGYKEPKEVTVLMNRLKEQADKLNKNTTLHVNNIRHQFKNSECGVYSMNFIIQLLKGKKFEDLCQNIVKDEKMEKNRNKLYIKYF